MSYPILAYNNILRSAQPQPGDLAAQFENIASPPLQTGIYAKQTTGELQINFDEAQTVNCLAIGRNNLQSVQLEVYQNSSWHSLTSLNCQKQCRLSTFNTATGQKFKFSFSSKENMFVAYLFLGKKLSFEIGVSQGFVLPRYALENRTYTNIVNNNWLGKSHWEKGVRFQVDFQFLTQAFYQQHLAAFVEHAISYPFFFSHDNENHPEQCVYGFLDDRRAIPKPRIEHPSWVDFGWTMQGICE